MASHLTSFAADHALITFAADYKVEIGLLAMSKISTAVSPAAISNSAFFSTSDSLPRISNTLEPLPELESLAQRAYSNDVENYDLSGCQSCSFQVCG